MIDHDADDSYFYKITVFTGLRRHAGTTSNIFFVLSGSQDDSRTRSLHGGVRKVGQEQLEFESNPYYPNN